MNWKSLVFTTLGAVLLLSLISYFLRQVNTATNTLELIRTTGTVLSGLGIFVAAWAFLLQRQVWRDYHERARREKGITLVAEFTRNYKLSWGAASRLVEVLDDHGTEKLCKGEVFKIHKDLVDHLKAALPAELAVHVKCDGELYELSLQQVYALQWEARTYLNSVELVLASGYEDVADSRFVIKQFRSSYDPERKRTLMQNLRSKCGGEETYPNIHRFVHQITQPNEPNKVKVGV